MPISISSRLKMSPSVSIIKKSCKTTITVYFVTKLEYCSRIMFYLLQKQERQISREFVEPDDAVLALALPRLARRRQGNLLSAHRLDRECLGHDLKTQ